MRMAVLATEAVLSPAVGAWLGFQIDLRMGGSPWGMLGGLLTGAAVALKLFWRLGKTEEKNQGE
jgi:F0F1-type ATP synthase assembly protein I